MEAGAGQGRSDTGGRELGPIATEQWPPEGWSVAVLEERDSRSIQEAESKSS